MKVRISYVVNVTEEARRGMRRFYGRDGMATREEIQQWYREFGASMDDDLQAEYGDARTESDKLR
jgi:hypothetical protein